MHIVLRVLLALSLLLVSNMAHAQKKAPLVLAAASLQESLTEAADLWARQGNPRPVLSFAASSALARQILSGAPADLFVSADEPWMDAVAAKGLVRSGTRVPFLVNRLVIVAPANRASPLQIRKGFPLARALGAGGRLSMADPDAVPAGKYGKAALQNLGVWQSVSARIARAENVRAALALVERGEAPMGIVYATDARASKRVRIVGIFPANSHPPITYPVAVLRSATSLSAEPFRRFLISPRAKAIFRRHGFIAR